MKILFWLSALFFLAGSAFADSASYYSVGRQTNPAADTVLADTDTLMSGGIVGANYQVSILMNGSVQMTYKLEVLDASDVIVTTIYLSAPANQATVIEPRATFFIPNSYSMRVRNETAVLLGGTLQASIVLKVDELVDQ